MKKRRLHTTLDERCYDIIEKYLPEYGRVNRVVEEALKFFDRYRDVYEKNIDCSLIELMEEANLVAFNAKTIEFVVSGEIEKAVCDNEVEIVLRKMYGKPLERISIDEAVEGIKRCLVTTRKATRVRIRRNGSQYYVLVTSNLGQNTDLLICEAVKRFFERNYGVKVSFEVFPQGYSMLIEM